MAAVMDWYLHCSKTRRNIVDSDNQCTALPVCALPGRCLLAPTQSTQGNKTSVALKLHVPRNVNNNNSALILVHYPNFLWLLFQQKLKTTLYKQRFTFYVRLQKHQTIQRIKYWWPHSWHNCRWHWWSWLLDASTQWHVSSTWPKICHTACGERCVIARATTKLTSHVNSIDPNLVVSHYIRWLTRRTRVQWQYKYGW